MLTNIERYSRALADCEAKAEACEDPEISQMWMKIASSYAFLLNREKRVEGEVAGRSYE